MLEGLWREWEGVRGEIEALRSEIFGNGNGSGDGDREGEGGDEFEAAIRELQEKLEGDVRAMGAEAVMGMVASEKVCLDPRSLPSSLPSIHPSFPETFQKNEKV